METSDIWPLQRECPLLPPPRLAEIREQQPVAPVELYDGTRCALVTRYADVRAVVVRGDVSADGHRENFPYASEAARAGRGARMAFDRMDPPRHDEHRFMLAAHFTTKRVAEMRPFLDHLVDELLDRMAAAGPPADLVRDFAEPLPAAVITEILGLPRADSAFFQDRVHTWFDDSSTAEDVATANADLIGYISSVLDERKEASGAGTGNDGQPEDLIATLVREQFVPGHLSRQELLDMIQLLIAAGYDTTANMIALGTTVLLQTDGAWRQLTDDPDSVAAAVEELLRFVSPAHHAVFRVANTDVPVGEEVIPAQTPIIASTMAANHDPQKYADPSRLDLRRNARGHLAFGIGLHQCLGQALARAELQSVFTHLPSRFPSLRLAAAIEELSFRNSLVYGLDSLPVSW